MLRRAIITRTHNVKYKTYSPAEMRLLIIKTIAHVDRVYLDETNSLSTLKRFIPRLWHYTYMWRTASGYIVMKMARHYKQSKETRLRHTQLRGFDGIEPTRTLLCNLLITRTCRYITHGTRQLRRGI